MRVYGQNVNETEAPEMSNMTVARGPGGTLPSMSTPGREKISMFSQQKLKT